MKHRIAVFFILLLTICSISMLAVIMTSYYPANAPTAALWLFFASLFCLFTAIFTTIWHFLKKLFVSKFAPPSIWSSIRQAALFSVVLVSGLFFNSLKTLSLWDLVPLCVAAILIEFFFQSDKQYPLNEVYE